MKDKDIVAKWDAAMERLRAKSPEEKAHILEMLTSQVSDPIPMTGPGLMAPPDRSRGRKVYEEQVRQRYAALLQDRIPSKDTEQAGSSMEDRDNSVINALKRLERAGSEHSKTTQKLIEAADRLAEHIEATLLDLVGEDGLGLPRNYHLRLHSRLYYVDGRETYYLAHGDTTRESALHFARDIATGWLDELAEWVEAQGEGNAEAIAKLDQAAKGMEAQP